MAKKNLASLMSGIMGEPAPAETKPIETAKPIKSSTTQTMPIVEVPNVAEESGGSNEDSEVNVTPQPIESTSPVSKPRIKRIEVKSTKDNKSKTAPYEEIRATFIVNPEHVRKIKYISLVEGNMIKDVIEEAFSHYIKSWETENERIRLPRRS